MKKIIMPVLIITAIMAVSACQKSVPANPGAVGTSTVTPTVTITATNVIVPDNSTFPFETPADFTGFSISRISSSLRFTSMQLSSENSYLGSSSLKIAVDFNAANSMGTLSVTGTALPMTGKTITAHIWIPNSMFTPVNPYGVFLYIQLPNNNWYQSAWQNLVLPPGAVPGIWNVITASVDNMVLMNGLPATNGKTLAENGEDGNTAISWGLSVGQGNMSLNYNGFIYIDSIILE